MKRKMWESVGIMGAPSTRNLREIYALMCDFNEKYEEYSIKQMAKYITDYFEYQDWVWNTKINRMCPEPFSFHIKTGSFIADEMKGQVLGVYREKTLDGYTDFQVMTKHEWRNMDIDTFNDTNEYWILNLEDMEAREYMDEDELDEHICAQIEIETTRIADIARGK